MGLLDKCQEKESIFVFDERDKVFVAQLNDIKFICEKVKDNYQQYAKDLADAYKSTGRQPAGVLCATPVKKSVSVPLM